MPPPKEKLFGFRGAPIRDTVRRNLFGKLNPNETSKLNEWLDRKEEETARAKAEKYGFDFANCKRIGGVLSDYEITMEDEKTVPLFYRSRTVGKRKRPALTEVREELDVCIGSTSQSVESQIVGPVTRSAARKKEGEKKIMKQSKMTNFLRLRKRRSMDPNCDNTAPAVKTRRMDSGAAPASPYTCVSHVDEIEFPESPTKSANSSPVKKRSHSSTPHASTAVRSLHDRGAASV